MYCKTLLHAVLGVALVGQWTWGQTQFPNPDIPPVPPAVEPEFATQGNQGAPQVPETLRTGNAAIAQTLYVWRGTTNLPVEANVANIGLHQQTDGSWHLVDVTGKSVATYPWASTMASGATFLPLSAGSIDGVTISSDGARAVFSQTSSNGSTQTISYNGQWAAPVTPQAKPLENMPNANAGTQQQPVWQGSLVNSAGNTVLTYFRKIQDGQWEKMSGAQQSLGTYTASRKSDGSILIHDSPGSATGLQIFPNGSAAELSRTRTAPNGTVMAYSNGASISGQWLGGNVNAAQPQAATQTAIPAATQTTTTQVPHATGGVKQLPGSWWQAEPGYEISHIMFRQRGTTQIFTIINSSGQEHEGGDRVVSNGDGSWTLYGQQQSFLLHNTGVSVIKFDAKGGSEQVALANGSWKN